MYKLPLLWPSPKTIQGTEHTLSHTNTLIYIDHTDIHNPSYTYTAKTATSTYQHKSQQQKHSKQPSSGILL